MTSLKHYRRMQTPIALLMIASLSFSQGRGAAADVFLSGFNGTLLDARSYSRGQLPLAGDTLVVNNLYGPTALTLTTSNNPSNAIINLNGIRLDPSMTATGLTLRPGDFGGTQKIVLGADGIDLRRAAGNLTINDNNGAGILQVEAGAAQTWNVGSGKVLNVLSDITGSNNITARTSGAGLTGLTLGPAASTGNTATIGLGSANLDLVNVGTRGVSASTITVGGTGYNPLSPPIVTLTGGGGVGATAVAVVSAAGVITGITITNSGYGYSAAPTITIGAPPSGGTAATATSTLATTAMVVNSAVDVGTLNLNASNFAGIAAGHTTAFNSTVKANTINAQLGASAALTVAGDINATTINLTNNGTGVITLNNITPTTSAVINWTNNSTGVLNLNGTISGTGTSLNLLNNSNALAILAGNTNTFTGPTTVTGGTLRLNYAATNANNKKLSNISNLTLNSAILEIAGVASGFNEEVSGLVVGSGFSRINRTAGTNIMRLNNITVNSGAALDLSAASIADTDRLNVNNILGGWATINGTSWAINSTNAADGAITALIDPAANNAANTWNTATANIFSNAAVTGSITANSTINSLKLTTAAQTISQSAGTTLTISSGGILLGGAFNRTLGAAGASLTAGANLTATTGELYVHANHVVGNNLTIASNIVDNGATSIGLVKTQAGTLILTGTNTYSGPTTIGGGVIQVGSGGTVGQLGAGAVNNNGTLVFNRSDNITIANNISGIGIVTKNLTNTLTLTGNNTFFGLTNITSGTLTAGSATALSPISLVSFATSGTPILDVTGFNTSVGGIVGGATAAGEIKLGNRTLTFGGSNTNSSYAGRISSSAGSKLIKTGLGTQTFTTPALLTTTPTASVLGAVEVNQGGLVFSGAVNPEAITMQGDLLALPGDNTVANPASFLSGITSMAGANTFNGAVSLSTDANAILPTSVSFGANANTTNFNGGLTVGAQVNFNLPGNAVFGGTGLIINQADNLILPGQLTFNAPLTLNGGNLTLSGNNLGTANIILNSGILTTSNTLGTITDTATVELNSDQSVWNVQESETIQMLQDVTDSRVNIAAAKALILNNGVSTSTLNASVTGAGSLVKQGTGSMNLTGFVAPSGGFEIAAGSVVLNSLGSNKLGRRLSVNLSSAGSILDINGRNEEIGSLLGSGNVSLGAGGNLGLGNDNISTSFGGTINETAAGGKIIKLGSGTQTLTGTSNITGGLEVRGGNLILSNSGVGASLSNSALNVSILGNNSTLQFNTAAVQNIGDIYGAVGTNLGVGASATLATTITEDTTAETIRGYSVNGQREIFLLDEPGTTNLRAGGYLKTTGNITNGTYIVQVTGANSVLLSDVIGQASPRENRSFFQSSYLASNLTGSGTFRKQGNGLLVLSGQHTNTGKLEMTNGAIQLGGIEAGGRYVINNVLSDSGELAFGTGSGRRIVSLAENRTNLQPFERIGGLSGGDGFSQLNLTNTNINFANSISTPLTGGSVTTFGALAIGGNNLDTTFNGIIGTNDGGSAPSALLRAVLVKEGTGVFSYGGAGNGIEAHVYVDDGKLKVLNNAGAGLANRSVLNISNKVTAQFEVEGVERIGLLIGGKGSLGVARNEALGNSVVYGVLRGNYLNNSVDAGTILLPGSSTRLIISDSDNPDAVSVSDFSGSIQGDGGISKIGSQTLRLSGSNTYKGQTTISDGSLDLSFKSLSAGVGTLAASEIIGKLSNRTLVDLTGNGKLVTNGITQVIGGLSGTTAASAVVSLGAGELYLDGLIGQSNANYLATYNGRILSGGGTADTGSGHQNLAKITIGAGTLTLGVNSNGANIDGPSIQVNNGATLALAQTSGSTNGSIGAYSNLLINSGGTVNITSSIASEALGSIYGAGTFNLGANRELKLNYAGGLSTGTFSGTISGSGTSRLTIAGGSLYLNTPQGYTGLTSVEGNAILNINTGTGSGLANIVPDGASLQVSQGRVVLSGDRTESFNGLSIQKGLTTLVADRSKGVNAQMQLNQITRGTGAALVVQENLVTTDTLNNRVGDKGILGGYAIVDGFDSWARNSTSGADGLIKGLTLDKYKDISAAGSTWAADDHVFLAANKNITGSGLTMATLSYGLPSTAELGQQTVLKLGGSLLLTDGGILVRSKASTSQLKLDSISATEVGSITSSSPTLAIHQQNDLASLLLNVGITGSLSVVKTGPGRLILTKQNSFTGEYINAEGITQIGDSLSGEADFSSVLAGNTVGKIVNHGIIEIVSKGGNQSLGQQIAMNVISGTGSLRSVAGTKGRVLNLQTTLGHDYSGKTVLANQIVSSEPDDFGNSASGTILASNTNLIFQSGSSGEDFFMGPQSSITLDNNSNVTLTGDLTIANTFLIDRPDLSGAVGSAGLKLSNSITAPFGGGISINNATASANADAKVVNTAKVFLDSIFIRKGTFELASINANQTGSLGRATITNNGILSFNTQDAHRVISNQILGSSVYSNSNVSGQEALSFNQGQYYLTGDNDFLGKIAVGTDDGSLVSSAIAPILNIGSETFVGSIGDNDIVVNAVSNGSSQVRFRRLDSFSYSGDLTLNPYGDNSIVRHAAFLKEGAGTLLFDGDITAGRIDTRFGVSTPASTTGQRNERAIVAAQQGRMVFGNIKIVDPTALSNVSSAAVENRNNPLSIYNSSYIEFSGDHSGVNKLVLTGELNNGLGNLNAIPGSNNVAGVWIFNHEGTIELDNNTKRNTESAPNSGNYFSGAESNVAGSWSGPAIIQRGILKSIKEDQFGNGQPIYVNGAELQIGQTGLAANNNTDTVGLLASTANGSIILNGITRLESSLERFIHSEISGGGALGNRAGITNLYSAANSFTGNLRIDNGTVRVRSIAGVGVDSALGKGSAILLGDLSSTGTLEYVGETPGSSNRSIQLNGLSGGGALLSSGRSSVTWSGDVTNIASQTKSFTLGGNSLVKNIFSGQIQNATNLVKAGNTTWRLEQSRSAYTGNVSITGGILELDSLVALGSTSATRQIRFSGNGIVSLNNTASSSEIFASGITLQQDGGTSGISNDGASTWTILGNLIQGVSQTDRTWVLGGTNTGNNIVSGAIIGLNLGVTKRGAGKWKLAGANDFGGVNGAVGSTVEAGTLVLAGSGPSGSLADRGTVTLNNGGATAGNLASASRLEVEASDVIGALNGQIGSSLLLNAGTNLTVQSNNSSFQGIVSGAGNLTVNSDANAATRVLTLSNLNTFTGGITLNGGSTNNSTSRVDAYYLADGGLTSSIGASSSAAANLVINTGSGTGGLRYIGFDSASTDRLFTVGAGGNGTDTAAAAISADGQTIGLDVPTLRFTNTGALAFSGSGARTFALRGNNRGMVDNPNTQGDDTAFNTFSPSIGNGVGGATSLLKLEDSIWKLDGNNTFTGDVMIRRGTLVIASNNALGAGANIVLQQNGGDNGRAFLDLAGVTITGKTVDIRSGNTANNTAATGIGASVGTNLWAGNLIANNTNGSRISVLGGGTSLEISGVISGNNPVIKAGNGTLILSGNNTFEGDFRGSGGKVVLDYSIATGSKLSDTKLLILGGTAFDSVQGARSRGQDNVVYNRGSVIELKGGSHEEIVRATTLNAGDSAIRRASAGTSKLRLNAITRSAGATLDFQDGSVANTTTASAQTGAVLVGGYGTVGQTTWATSATTIAAGTRANITGLATFDGVNNVDVTASTTLSANAATLRFNAVAANTLTLGAAVQLTNNGILVTPNVGNNLTTITGTATNTLTAPSNSREIIVHQHNTAGALLIDAPIVNSGANAVGLTKAGAGELLLRGNNTYTGVTSINQGRVVVGTPSISSQLGSGQVNLSGELVWDTTGPEFLLSRLQGDGVMTLAATNTRNIRLDGSNSNWQGIINVNGGALIGESDGRVFGNGRSVVNVGVGGTMDLRSTLTNDPTNNPNSAVDIYLAGKLKGSVPLGLTPLKRFDSGHSGTLTIQNNTASVEVDPSAQLTLNGIIYSQFGLKKTGLGRLILNNANYFDSSTPGFTFANANATLTGQIAVQQGELWIQGARPGAVGVGNEVVVSPGASVDLRGNNLSFGDDSGDRKIFRISGTGLNNSGALRNTTGTASFARLVLDANATVAGSEALVLQPFDNDVNGGAFTSQQAATIAGNNNVLTKAGTNDFIIRDSQITGISQLRIQEGEVRFELVTPQTGNVGDNNLTPSAIGSIVIGFGGVPAVVGTANPTYLLEATQPNLGSGPVVGARLEFFRNLGSNHTVPITMQGDWAANNKGANYLELNSDGNFGPRTTLSGAITLIGAAKNNIFNIEGGTGAGVIADQGSQTVLNPGKLILAGGTTGAGGFTKVGSRELRAVSDLAHTGETLITRSGSINASVRSDNQDINGVTVVNAGLGESRGEYGLTLTGANGKLSGTSAIILERSGFLTLDNSTALDASSGSVTTAMERVNDAANIILRTGTLRIHGASAANTTETLATGSASLQGLQGVNNIDLWTADGSNRTLRLNIGAIQRSAGSVLRFRALDSTVDFSATATSTTDAVRVAVANASGLTQYGTGTNTKIVHGVLGGAAPHKEFTDTRITNDLFAQDRNRQNAAGSDFMTLDNGFLRPLTKEEYYTPANQLIDGTGVTGKNINLTDLAHYTRESVNINSLRFGPVSSSTEAINDATMLTSYTNGWTPTLIVDDGAQLDITSGMISSATFSVGADFNNSTFIRGGRINFGAVEGIINNQNARLRLTDGIYAGNNFEIQSIITGSAGLTKVGSQTVTLDARNEYTGLTTVAEGSLNVRSGRSGLGVGGTGNGIVIDGTGELRLDRGIQLGTAAAREDLVVNLTAFNNQNILRSDNGNNVLYGNILYNGVDSAGHAQPVGRPTISVSGNQGLTIQGNITGGSALVSEDVYYTDSRLIALSGAGYIRITGQVADGVDGSGVPQAANGIASSLTTGSSVFRGGQTLPAGSPTTAINENQLFRLQLVDGNLNVTFGRQHNAVGRLAVDNGVVLADYDPASLSGGETGFFTNKVLSSLVGHQAAYGINNYANPTDNGLDVVGAANANTTNGSREVTLPLGVGTVVPGMSVNGPGIPAGTTVVGIRDGNVVVLSNNATATATGASVNFNRTLIAGNANPSATGGNTAQAGFSLGDGTNSAAFFFTKAGQNFNLSEWRYTGGNATAFGGLNSSGTVTFGTGLGSLVMDRNARVYANDGGQVDLNYHLIGSALEKQGRGTVTLRNTGVFANATTNSFTIAGGTLRVDFDNSLNVALLNTNTGSGVFRGGDLVAVGDNTGDRTLNIGADNTADNRFVDFQTGHSQVIAEARGAVNMTVNLANNRGQTNATVRRSAGSTASFIGYNSTGGTGRGILTLSPNATSANNATVNQVIPWATYGIALNTALDFAMSDSGSANAVTTFRRSPQEYKNNVSTWATGEDVSENTLNSAGGSGFYGTLAGSLNLNTLRFDSTSDSEFNIGSGNTLNIGNSGILVSSNTDLARKTISGGTLAAAVVRSGSAVSGSTTITGLSSTADLFSGLPVSGPGISPSTSIAAVVSGTTIELNNAVTENVTNGDFTFGNTELIFHQYGKGELVINSKIGTASQQLGASIVTVGSTQLLVLGVEGLESGQRLIGPNIPAGTTITNFTGNKVRLTQAALKSAPSVGINIGGVAFIGATVAGSTEITLSTNATSQKAADPRVSNGIKVDDLVSATGDEDEDEDDVLPPFISVAWLPLQMSQPATGSNGNAVVTVGVPLDLTITGPSTTQQGAAATGAVVINSKNEFYGRTSVNGGVLSISAEEALGSTPATDRVDQLTLNGGTLRFTGTVEEFSRQRGITLRGQGGVIDVARTDGHLIVRRALESEALYRGDLIKRGPGILTLQGFTGSTDVTADLDVSGGMPNFRGLIDVQEGTLRMASNNPAGGTSLMFGTNTSWADGTIMRNGTNLMLQMSAATTDWNFEEFITFEGNNHVTIGTIGAPNNAANANGNNPGTRQVNWNGPTRINGRTTFDTVPTQTFRLGNGGGYLEGTGDIVKDGLGTLEFRENSPDWKGGLTIEQGRVVVVNQADALGLGHTVGKSITLGSSERSGNADLFLNADLGAAGTVWEVNMPINVTYNQAQSLKRIGVINQPGNGNLAAQGAGGMTYQFNGDITLNDNLGLYYEEANNSVPWGGEFVHIEYNGAFKDGLTRSGNLIAHAREGAANDNSNGRVYVYHKFNGNNAAWTGDVVISDNSSYNHDVNNIVRLGSANALSNKNDIIMNYNSILQAGGNTVNVGALITNGGDGQLYTNVGTMGASGSGSSEVIENAAATPGTLIIHQSTPAQTEVKWDALFRDGTLPSHYLQPGQSSTGAALNIVKQGNGWATLTLDNDHTGTTTLNAGILQVGVDGIGDTGATRAMNVLGLTSAVGTTLAGTGIIQGRADISGMLHPGDVAGRGMGTLFVNGDLDLKATSTIELQIQRATLNVPELLKLTSDLNKPIQYDDRKDYFFVSTNLTGLENGYYTPDTLATADIDEHDQIRVAGDLNVASGAQFSVILNGYTARAGDVFKLLDFAQNVSTAWNVGSQFRDGSETGTQLTLPFLGNNFRWDTSLFTTKGLLLVVGIDGPPHDPASEDPEVNRGVGIGAEDHPQQRLLPLGSSVSFSSEVTLGTNTTYQFDNTWFKNGTELLDPDSRMTGLAGGTVQITELGITDVGKYSARFTGITPGAPTLNSSAAVLALYDDVDFTKDPVRFTKDLKAGSAVSLSVTAYAPAGVALQYEWGKFVNNEFEQVTDNLFPLLTDVDVYSGATTKTLKITKFSSTATYVCRITLLQGLDVVTGSARSVLAGMQQLNLLAVPALGLASTDPWPTTPALIVGTPYSFQFPLPSNSSPVSKWTATGLPAGLSINATTGVISGTPTENKTWDKVRITASNATGATSWPTATTFGTIVVAPGIEVTNTTIAVVRGKVATASVKVYKNNVSYQWYRADAPTVPLVNGVTANGSKLAGATSSKLTITGFTDVAPSNVGGYFCKVTVKQPPATSTLVLDSGMTNFVIMQDPDLQGPGTGMDDPLTLPPATVGALYTHQFPVVNDPSRPLAWSIKGLPAGLKMDAKTGVISGTITKLPSTALYNSATNSYTISTIEVTGKNAVATVRSPVAVGTFHTLVVKALPVNAVGNFVALIDREGVGATFGSTKRNGGRVTLTATTSGAVTGKVFIGKDNTKGLSFKTKLVTTDLTGATLPEPTGVAYILRKGKSYLQVDFTLRAADVMEGIISERTGGIYNKKTLVLTGSTLVAGSLTEMSGWRSKWVTKIALPFNPTVVLPSVDQVGLHNVSLKLNAPASILPEGTGYAAINVAGTGKSAGNVTVVGKTALGEAFTCAAPLSPLGEVLVYAGVNSDKKVFTGSLHGFINIQSTPNAHRINDTAGLTWGRAVQPSTERKYRKGWDTPLAVDVAGGLYVAPVVNKALSIAEVVLGLTQPAAPTVNNASILFTGGGIAPAVGDTSAIRGDIGTATTAAFQIFSPASNNISKLPVGGNNGKTALTITAKTGIYTGNFTAVDRATVPAEKVTRAKVPFGGMVVPLVGQPSATNTADFSAVGYFLLPEMLPAPATATTKTPVNSGKVEIKALP